MTPKFGCFDDEEFDERQFERHLASNPALALAECWYWIRKLQARFFAGDYARRLDASSRAQRLLWTSPSLFETAEYHFYGALSARHPAIRISPTSRQQHLEALAAHHQQLEVWAENCPENFENRAALVGAEIARIEGRALDAEAPLRTGHPLGTRKRLCPQRGARQRTRRALLRGARLRARSRIYICGTPATATFAGEPTARCGNSTSSIRTSGRNEPVPGPTSTIGGAGRTPGSRDRDQSSQAVSGEIVLEKLIDTLMRTAIEQAGAERGLLILAARG